LFTFDQLLVARALWIDTKVLADRPFEHEWPLGFVKDSVIEETRGR